jgi:hypothetical protein
MVLPRGCTARGLANDNQTESRLWRSCVAVASLSAFSFRKRKLYDA